METTRLKFEEICWKKGNYTTKEYQTESDANSIGATGMKIVEALKQIADKETANMKKDDLRSMLKYMPLVDKQYYKSTGIE